jgi:hypothetical protein
LPKGLPLFFCLYRRLIFMATEGIIFGGHLLSKEEFTLVIEK